MQFSEQDINKQTYDDDIAYGCLFCSTGSEEAVAFRIREHCQEVQALTMRKIKYFTTHGQRRSVEALLLPGYVFFRCKSDVNPFQTLPRTDIIRILCTEKFDWHLYGSDEQFAKWLFSYNGLLGLSQCYREGERIHIVSGPLKDMEGNVARIDKHGLSGQVTVDFNGKTIPIWLNFELIDRNTVEAHENVDESVE